MSQLPAPALAKGSRVLDAMPHLDAVRIQPHLEPVPLAAGQALFEAGDWIEHVWFIDSGAVSFVADQGVGRQVEIGLVGSDGVVGVTALMGEPQARFRALVQVAGEARRAPVATLRPMLHASYGMRDLFMRIATAALHRAAMAAACNALHPLPERAAGWLLSLHDRVGPGFAVTQEVMANMLGARRPTVNAVMRRFVAEGLVRTARGRVTISDVAGLEAAACPCRRALAVAAPGPFAARPFIPS
jgi:CRP-like cAMP-binding protein